ncbi:MULTISPECIES: flagella basal body P-ring formation protein FlgA [unclassified Lysobacter]|uniref:flagella basal body P-ring formation protein FlgA n=1 Tax=unclassified Lysobacter TaxID=2635362 RepID=UPI001BE943AE|nr:MULTISPECIES: flagella basal body P-ring formation protein FlgA [unclassified Lysobacter]MBT2745977.1 flagella basal body P-ring formation protein FlgA [Lysobacter sp. ISL-42]MBT2752639.1 flagella basal body P-ring formation protein FlgA [Lysobacter sp. ISL-50]MBT2777378.1 flagella basal body P-ring formation protein FlgA [Lysobacter sp. ISL-54]MBT2783569.1 flagella basal body P-ring formation protein FlgA [Lysobacter sp. ISL-52]
MRALACAALIALASPLAAAAAVKVDSAVEGPTSADSAPAQTASHAAVAERACLRVLGPVARGQALRAADVRGERCGADTVVQRAHYDRDSGLVRAPVDLVAGDAIAPVAASLFADVRQGDKLALIYRDGPIAISRNGVAARDAKAGAPVRVAMGDGAIVTAPVSPRPSSSSIPSSSLAGETP